MLMELCWGVRNHMELKSIERADSEVQVNWIENERNNPCYSSTNLETIWELICIQWLMIY